LPAILFDLGGTHIRGAVASTCANPTNATLQSRIKRHIPNFLTKSAPATVWDELLQLICSYVTQVSELVQPSDPVIVSFPGPVDSAGRVIAAPTIIGRQSSFPDLRATISSATGRPTYLLNDMSAAAWHLSTVTNSARFIAVTISSGIGSKIFDRTSSRGVLDDVPYAGEIGHVLVDGDPTAPLCDCGSKGHLGAVSSGRGIERAARQQAEEDKTAFSKSLCATRFGAAGTTLNNESHLVPAALAHDPWAVDVIRRCTRPLGHMLRSLTVAAGLDRILVSGGFAQSLGPLYIEILQETMNTPDPFPGFPIFDSHFIQLCRPDDEVCLLGAATYAHQRLGLS
jgi:predicted NBD/HSP70 family sugar kinase